MRIYVAGPYTQGNLDANLRNAILAGDALLLRGHTPFIPHLTHFWELVSPHAYERWMAYDAEWVRACDGLLRLPGYSPGADEEEQLARELGKPVYHQVSEIPDAVP